MLKKRGIPTIIYVNKMDKENVNFDAILEDIHNKISKKCVPFCLPLGHESNFDGFVNVVDLKARKYNGKECVDDVIHDDKRAKILELHNMIMEQVAVADDALLEKFFAGEELTQEELMNVRAGMPVGMVQQPEADSDELNLDDLDNSGIRAIDLIKKVV